MPHTLAEKILLAHCDAGCRLKFVNKHNEISIHQGIVIRSGKRRPRVHTHVLVDSNAMHFRRATDREFHHSIF